MEDCPCTVSKSQFVRQILSYIIDHPDSSDTLEGIVQWWLLEQSINQQKAKVEEALAELIEKGFVLENKGRDLQTRYRINKSKYEEIRTMLT